MKPKRAFGMFAAITMGAAILGWPQPVWACAACYGQSDSAMAVGMNWGIFVLLGVIGVVLTGVAAFFVFVAARPAKWRNVTADAPSLSVEEKEA
jgi:hypothetical protein